MDVEVEVAVGRAGRMTSSVGQRKAALQSSFLVQANALTRKNLRLQARQWKTNACLVSFPIILFLILIALQAVFDKLLFGGSAWKCGCSKDNPDKCGIEFSTAQQAAWCPVKNPPLNPAFLQMPNVTAGMAMDPLATIVPVTGNNRSMVEAIGRQLFDNPEGGNHLLLASYWSEESAVEQALLSILPISPNGTTPTGHIPLISGTAKFPTLGAPLVDPAFTGDDAEWDPLFLISNSCLAFSAAAGGSSGAVASISSPAMSSSDSSTSSSTDNKGWVLRPASFGGNDFGGKVSAGSFVHSGSKLRFLVACYEARATYFPPNFELDFLGMVFSGGRDALKTTKGFNSTVEAFLYNRYFAARPSNQELKRGGKEYVPGVVAAFDFKDSNPSRLDLNVWYNRTYAKSIGRQPDHTLRIARSFNLATKAFFSWVMGGGGNNNGSDNVSESLLPLLYVKEFPKVGTSVQLDVSSFFGPFLFVWVLGLVLPVVCNSLVYEKEVRLRSMMKMHGLSDGAYWAITYLYFLALSVVYMLFFVGVGAAIRLKIFTLNDASIILVFLFIFFNNLIAFGFLWSAIFTSTKTITVSAYLYVFGSGLLAEFLFRFFLRTPSTSRGLIFAFELVPAFALFRGLYEFANYSYEGNYQSTTGMRWSNLSDGKNGLTDMMAILATEWIIFLLLALYVDQIIDTGVGVTRHPLFFLDWRLGGKRGKKRGGGERKEELELPTASRPGKRGDGRGVPSSCEAIGEEDVAAEKQTAKAALQAVMEGESGGREGRRSPSSTFSIVCDELQKVYRGLDGNPDKLAVKGMSLAVPRGECFGMLGPNGAGKTTSINMMVGFLEPTSGTALIEGMDIRTEMGSIHSIMGVCPQHNLLWDTLTGREHLLFYGRLKNLKGEELEREVEMWLRKMNLYDGAVLAKPVRAYSGGMKRRLSVAISLIGNPLVVYMDEPSTGLDPASRNNLWKVMKEAKKDRAIILTTHSMEEAEALCDRLGIFVDGQFACIGNPKELTARYGGTYDLTMTSAAGEESVVEALALSLSARAKKVYSLGGTQKFELPSSDVDLADVFDAVDRAKTEMNIQAWGIANTTLEDVFIKVAERKESETLH
ncbi:hypothetical protein CBR_g42101 [Chara braunii]|uniref:ABC transporter domain-containing protein n=1 Tax=Chara braunii TaxID=69332 RepID=A0A388LWX2_CHABU|nr:hypothetical protein CBR_g42101 [Chara braunii]|eukprot:GBG86818.1 hypothetical protein CBR_g42101 [Chara braunii]